MRKNWLPIGLVLLLGVGAAFAATDNAKTTDGKDTKAPAVTSGTGAAVADSAPAIASNVVVTSAKPGDVGPQQDSSKVGPRPATPDCPHHSCATNCPAHGCQATGASNDYDLGSSACILPGGNIVTCPQGKTIHETTQDCVNVSCPPPSDPPGPIYFCAGEGTTGYSCE